MVLIKHLEVQPSDSGIGEHESWSGPHIGLHVWADIQISRNDGSCTNCPCNCPACTHHPPSPPSPPVENSGSSTGLFTSLNTTLQTSNDDGNQTATAKAELKVNRDSHEIEKYSKDIEKSGIQSQVHIPEKYGPLQPLSHITKIESQHHVAERNGIQSMRHITEAQPKGNTDNSCGLLTEDTLIHPHVRRSRKGTSLNDSSSFEQPSLENRIEIDRKPILPVLGCTADQDLNLVVPECTSRTGLIESEYPYVSALNRGRSSGIKTNGKRSLSTPPEIGRSDYLPSIPEQGSPDDNVYFEDKFEKPHYETIPSSFSPILYFDDVRQLKYYCVPIGTKLPSGLVSDEPLQSGSPSSRREYIPNIEEWKDSILPKTACPREVFPDNTTYPKDSLPQSGYTSSRREYIPNIAEWKDSILPKTASPREVFPDSTTYPKESLPQSGYTSSRREYIPNIAEWKDSTLPKTASPREVFPDNTAYPKEYLSNTESPKERFIPKTASPRECLIPQTPSPRDLFFEPLLYNIDYQTSPQLKVPTRNVSILHRPQSRNKGTSTTTLQKKVNIMQPEIQPPRNTNSREFPSELVLQLTPKSRLRGKEAHKKRKHDDGDEDLDSDSDSIYSDATGELLTPMIDKTPTKDKKTKNKTEKKRFSVKNYFTAALPCMKKKSKDKHKSSDPLHEVSESVFSGASDDSSSRDIYYPSVVEVHKKGHDSGKGKKKLRSVHSGGDSEYQPVNTDKHRRHDLKSDARIEKSEYHPINADRHGRSGVYSAGDQPEYHYISSDRHRRNKTRNDTEDKYHPVNVDRHRRVEPKHGVQSGEDKSEYNTVDVDKQRRSDIYSSGDHSGYHSINIDRNERNGAKSREDPEYRPVLPDRNRKNDIPSPREEYSFISDRNKRNGIIHSGGDKEYLTIIPNTMEYRPVNADKLKYSSVNSDKSEYHPVDTDKKEYHPVNADKLEYRNADKLEYYPVTCDGIRRKNMEEEYHPLTADMNHRKIEEKYVNELVVCELCGDLKLKRPV